MEDIDIGENFISLDCGYLCIYGKFEDAKIYRLL